MSRRSTTARMTSLLPLHPVYFAAIVILNMVLLFLLALSTVEPSLADKGGEPTQTYSQVSMSSDNPSSYGRYAYEK